MQRWDRVVTTGQARPTGSGVPAATHSRMLALAVLGVVAAAACTQPTSPEDPEGAGGSPASRSPTSSATPASRTEPTLAPAPSGPGLDLDRLPRGEPPKVAYLDHTVMILPGGNRVPLQNESVPPELAHEAPGRFYFGFARVGRSWLTSTDSMGAILQLHRFDGSLANGWLESDDVIASSVGGRRALGYHHVVEHDGTVKPFHGWGIGFVGRDILVTDDEGSRMYLGYPGRGFTRVPRLRTPTATASRPGFVIAESENPPPAFKNSTTPGVFQLPSRKPILLIPSASEPFQGHDTVTLHGLSPDGAHIVATQPRPRPRTLVVARVDSGDVVVVAHGVVVEESPYWEDNRHFLVVTKQRHGRSVSDYILRIGVDGTVERAVGPTNAWFILPAPRS